MWLRVNVLLQNNSKPYHPPLYFRVPWPCNWFWPSMSFRIKSRSHIQTWYVLPIPIMLPLIVKVLCFFIKQALKSFLNFWEMNSSDAVSVTIFSHYHFVLVGKEVVNSRSINCIVPKQHGLKCREWPLRWITNITLVKKNFDVAGFSCKILADMKGGIDRAQSDDSYLERCNSYRIRIFLLGLGIPLCILCM